MTPAARVAAAIEVLDAIIGGTHAESALRKWGKRSRFAGAKDRAALRDLVFEGVRCKRSLAALGGAETGRGLMLGLARRDGMTLDSIFGAAGHAPPAATEDEVAHMASDIEMSEPEAHDLPDWLWPRWLEDLGENARAIAKIQQSRAAVFLRVNTRRVSRAEAVSLLAQDQIGAAEHPDVATALIVLENPRKIMRSQAYLNGLVEVQDAASQAAMLALDLPQRARVLDYCAGGGGKALALADIFAADVTAHDISSDRMADLPDRAARNRVEVAVAAPGSLCRDEAFDVVLCDAPCSGSGTWRRTPEAKWALTAGSLAAYHQTQVEVLRAASPLVAPKGLLAYATCSVLRAENEDTVAAFLAACPEWQVCNSLTLTPDAEHDGFYLTQLRRR